MDATVIDQKTAEWFEVRKYKYTSSNIWRLMSDPKNKGDKEAGLLSQTAITYVMEKVTEELGGYLPEANGAAISWGNDYEPLAKDWYERLSGFKVIEQGFVKVNSFYGGSPDAKVTQKINDELVEGALEIKCPHNSRVHLEHCMINSVEKFKSDFPDKYWQCVSHMDTLNVGFCDFVSFDPRINSELGFFCFRLIRNEGDVSLIHTKMEKANKLKAEIKAYLLSLNAPKP